MSPIITAWDVMALIWAMRGVAQASGEVAPTAWQRYLDIHLAGMRAEGPLSSVPAMTATQLARLSQPPAPVTGLGHATTKEGGSALILPNGRGSQPIRNLHQRRLPPRRGQCRCRPR